MRSESGKEMIMREEVQKFVNCDDLHNSTIERLLPKISSKQNMVQVREMMGCGRGIDT